MAPRTLYFGRVRKALGRNPVVVIDEAQRQPGLFPALRVLADRAEQPAMFLILGSASPELSRQTAESQAGRVEIFEMRGFDLGELPSDAQQTLTVRPIHDCLVPG